MNTNNEVIFVTHYQGVYHVQLTRYRFGSSANFNQAIRNAIEQGKRLGL